MLAIELQGLVDLEFDVKELTEFSFGEIKLMLDEAAHEKTEEPAPDDELATYSLGPAVLR